MEDGLIHLVDFIGAMRVARNGDTVVATVHEAGHGVKSVYDVRARTPTGTFELSTDGFAMSYRPADGQLLSSEGGILSRPAYRPHFPMTPVVLAMFSPLDLPIWGGPNDNNRVTSATSDGPGLVRLEFGPRDEPDDAELKGYAFVDLDLGVVLEMRYLGNDHLTSDIRTVPDMPSP
ncbi:hypothetical protein ACX8Z9_14555 [Arthrobacter halodurans]|uniref:Uncharacterized protein n=1 Tax=Arthrobacter halodurans TaxID=516699 RepID=A0ABV4UKV3_9MICC